jgi:hypothetical protein
MRALFSVPAGRLSNAILSRRGRSTTSRTRLERDLTICDWLSIMMLQEGVAHPSGGLIADGRKRQNADSPRSLRPARRYLIVLYGDIGPEVRKIGWTERIIAQASVLYCQVVHRLGRGRVAGVAPDAILSIPGRACGNHTDPFRWPESRV